jgi:hypothetical protein
MKTSRKAQKGSPGKRTRLQRAMLQKEREQVISRRKPVMSLADIPIDRPSDEKRLIEDGVSSEFLNYLSRIAKLAPIVPGELDNRIVEIHRLCYEGSPPAERESVVRDFIALSPDLIFKAEWLAKLIRRHAKIQDFDPESARSKLFLAIADGFKSAADSASRSKLFLRPSKLGAAKEFRSCEMLPELTQWEKGLDRRNAHSSAEWRAEIANRAERKTAELVNRHPCLHIHRGQLTRLLSSRQLYQASLLVAATVFCVSARELERGSHLSKS